MTASDSERSRQGGDSEYPMVGPAGPPDPGPTVDYPADDGLPPPAYPLAYPAGYSGYQGFSGAYDPYQPVKPPGTNGTAIAALVTSILGLFCCGLPSVAGLILGVAGMRQTRRTGQDGYAIALVGAIVGGLVLAGWVAYLLLLVAIYATGRQWGP